MTLRFLTQIMHIKEIRHLEEVLNLISLVKAILWLFHPTPHGDGGLDRGGVVIPEAQGDRLCCPYCLASTLQPRKLRGKESWSRELLWGRTKESGADLHSFVGAKGARVFPAKQMWTTQGRASLKPCGVLEEQWYASGESVCSGKLRTTWGPHGGISWKRKVHGLPHGCHSWVLAEILKKIHEGVSSRICHVQRAQSQLMILLVKLEHSVSFSQILSQAPTQRRIS